MALTKAEKEELEKIIRLAIREYSPELVHETLISLGIESDDPTAMQKDMAWVRQFRETSEATRSTIWKSLITLVVGGIATAIMALLYKY